MLLLPLVVLGKINVKDSLVNISCAEQPSCLKVLYEKIWDA